ncbi:SusE domain-containing protein [Urechidicola vernalis]|uniref:SusE domain-containing protein n=1 Tax=Urechidicola vernalis TaxID=3075600 RepID=A0ABU2Y343_9FLAO|nr:SusE domain-containing protein [Urechidicola sp. P050]MDT0552618.1 SusE domain-containing protein [Urechidicola sp. P050]
MKNLTYKIFMLLVAPIMLISCSNDDDIVTLNSSATVDVSLSSSSVVLDPATPDAEALKITWARPDFGYSAAPIYKVLIDNADGDFSAAASITAGSNLEVSLTTSQLNSHLLNLGFEKDMPADVNIKVIAELGDYNSIESSISVLNATAYEDKLDLSTNWGVVGSAANDWGATPDLPFYTTDQAGVLVAYVNLIDGEIKFRENNAWDLNYGDDGADGTLDEGGANIAVTAGSYKIEMNLNNLTYTMESYTWGLVGDATPNGWDGPDAQLTYDPYSDQWRAIVELTDGEMKFRLNNDWGTNYGDDGADGTLENGGANIAVSAGIYIVTANFDDLTYSMEEIQYIWGAVGSATPNGWDGPDVQFTRDWSTNDEVWILNGVTLVDGEWKIRANNDWGLNFGDTGLDGVMENGGDNIPATAGTYNISVSFVNPDAPTYTIE